MRELVVAEFITLDGVIQAARTKTPRAALLRRLDAALLA
jgi:hypothetical protein